jgi:tetratricopeptide (TPR) repeat protein
MFYLARNCFLVSLVVLLLIIASPNDVVAQYQGAAVSRDRLVQTLRSKRFPTRDIVRIIEEHGVDFQLTPATRSELVSAGARPEVLLAVEKNYRRGSAANRPSSPGTAGQNESYEALLDMAIEAFDVQKDNKMADNYLQRAVKMQPRNPRAYQLLGFLNLYGSKDFDNAEKYWKRSIDLGGNAVLRVTHDHDGSFFTSCQGSLYISKNIVRFESDNNVHTFETRDSNIKSIDVNSRWRRAFQVKAGSFRVVLEKEDETERYNFAPYSGKTDESRMIIRLIGKGR